MPKNITDLALPKNLENLNEKQKNVLLNQYLDSIKSCGYSTTFSINFFNLLDNKRFCSIVLKQIYADERTKIADSILWYKHVIEKNRKELSSLQEQSEKNKKLYQAIIEKIATKEIILNQKIKETAINTASITEHGHNLLEKEEEISKSLTKYSYDFSRLKPYNIIKKYIVNRKLCKLPKQLCEIEQIKSIKLLSDIAKGDIEILAEEIEQGKLNIKKLSFAKAIEEKINIIVSNQELIQKEKNRLDDLKEEYEYYLDSTDLTEGEAAIINLIKEYYTKHLWLYDLGNYIDNVLYNNDQCDDYEYDSYNQQMYLSQEAYDSWNEKMTKEQKRLRKSVSNTSKEYDKLSIETIASLERLKEEVNAFLAENKL